MEDSLQQVYQGILNEICELSDNTRPKLHKPFVFEEYVYATNGEIAVRFHKTNINNYEELEVWDIPKLWFEYFDNKTINKTYSIDIKSFIDMSDFTWMSEEIDCPECNGQGRIVLNYISKKSKSHSRIVQCPVCIGQGIIQSDNDRKYKKYTSCEPCLIADVIFSSFYIGHIIKIAEVFGQNTFNLVHKTGRNNACIFTTHDIEILLMPLQWFDLIEYGDALLFTLD